MLGHRQTTVTSLLANSMLPLGLSMLGLVLATIEPEPPGIWRWGSGILLVATMSSVMATGKTFRRLNLRNAQRQRITRFIFYLVGAFGTAAMLLQLYNISSLAAFWPFSLASYTNSSQRWRNLPA